MFKIYIMSMLKVRIIDIRTTSTDIAPVSSLLTVNTLIIWYVRLNYGIACISFSFIWCQFIFCVDPSWLFMLFRFKKSLLFGKLVSRIKLFIVSNYLKLSNPHVLGFEYYNVNEKDDTWYWRRACSRDSRGRTVSDEKHRRVFFPKKISLSCTFKWIFLKNATFLIITWVWRLIV